MGLRHLLSIRDLDAQQIQELLEKARNYQKTFGENKSGKAVKGTSFSKATALLFLENSTRTQISFQRACQFLGKPVVVIDPEKSSLKKGESLIDTLRNIEALECDQIVIRCTEENVLHELAKQSPLTILNAGDGTHEHPTQALLDLFTLLGELADFSYAKVKKLRIGICGDLSHSRVAQSWAHLAKLFDLQVKFYSPAEWRPRNWTAEFGSEDALAHELRGLDVIMALRVQRERFGKGENVEADIRKFQKNFQLNQLRLEEQSSPWLMHPGPVNWGTELHEDLMEYKKSLILKQVNYGVYLRAAVIESFAAKE
jgi:aspartate carbamoyltransferase catalytic subunit